MGGPDGAVGAADEAIPASRAPRPVCGVCGLAREGGRAMLALLALGLAAEHHIGGVVGGLAVRLTRVSRVVVGEMPFTGLRAGLRAGFATWSDRGARELAVGERIVTEFGAAVLRDVVQTTLDAVDVDRLLARVDVAALARRLDLAELVREVLEEVRMDEMIRDSTGSLAAETVDAVRRQGADADAALSRIVDRLLRRRGGRDLVFDVAPATGGTDPSPDRDA